MHTNAMLSVSEAVPILEDTQVELKQFPLRASGDGTAAASTPDSVLEASTAQMRTRSATSTTPELHPGMWWGFMSRWRKALITAPSTCKPSVTPRSPEFLVYSFLIALVHPATSRVLCCVTLAKRDGAIARSLCGKYV
ncbi:unnamed protein product [Arctogadus glacialis]